MAGCAEGGAGGLSGGDRKGRTSGHRQKEDELKPGVLNERYANWVIMTTPKGRSDEKSSGLGWSSKCEGGGLGEQIGGVGSRRGRSPSLESIEGRPRKESKRSLRT